MNTDAVNVGRQAAVQGSRGHRRTGDFVYGIKGGTEIVTVAASGNGRATAERFAEEGASVVVADMDVADGEETVEGFWIIRLPGITAQGENYVGFNPK